MTALVNLIINLIALFTIWFIIGGAVWLIYVSKRHFVFDLEEGHIYVADIIMGLVCLPVTIILGFCFLGDKLIHIKIK